MSRTTVSLSQEAYDALDAEKRGDESFTDVVLRICGGSPDTDSGTSDIHPVDADELLGRLDDLQSSLPKQTADKVESRLRR